MRSIVAVVGMLILSSIPVYAQQVEINGKGYKFDEILAEMIFTPRGSKADLIENPLVEKPAKIIISPKQGVGYRPSAPGTWPVRYVEFKFGVGSDSPIDLFSTLIPEVEFNDRRFLFAINRLTHDIRDVEETRQFLDMFLDSILQLKITGSPICMELGGELYFPMKVVDLGDKIYILFRMESVFPVPCPK